MLYTTKYSKVSYPILYNYIKILKFFFVCMDLGMHMYLPVLMEELQELELQVGLMWMLEMELMSPVRTASILSSRQGFIVEPWLSWN